MIEPGPVVAHGSTADVFAYGRGAVVKVPRDGVPRHWARLEAELTMAVHAQGLPTPAVHDLVEIGGRESIVFQRIDGPSLWQRMLAEPRGTVALARVLADVHLEVHSYPAPAALPRLVDRITSKIAAVDLISGVETVHALEIVSRLPAGSVLCHGDLHPGNVLMSRDGPMVIDWFDAAVGSAAADVVRTSLLVRPFTNGPRAHLPHGSGELLDAIHIEYLRRVLEASAMENRLLSDWEAILAVGRLAEGVSGDTNDLLEIWRSHPGSSVATGLTALGRALQTLGIDVPDDLDGASAR